MAQNTDFAKVALAQVGKGPSTFRKWYYGNEAKGTAWCAVAVSYDAAQVDGLLNKIIPQTDGAGCFAREGVAKKWGKWYEGGSIPKVGDIISFCWNGLGCYPGQDAYFSDHVGIVVEVKGNNVYVVEGNTGGTNDTSTTKKKCYAINNVYINGYYRPNWKTVSSEGSNGQKPSYTVTGKAAIKAVQTWCNKEYGTNCNPDGIYGSQTKSALVGCLQCYLNKKYGARLVVDGIWGPATKSAIRVLRKGCTKTDYVYILQGALICHGYDTGGFDGEFGTKTLTAVKSFQKAKKLVVDGEAGKETFSKLLS